MEEKTNYSVPIVDAILHDEKKVKKLKGTRVYGGWADKAKEKIYNYVVGFARELNLKLTGNEIEETVNETFCAFIHLY